MEQSWSYKAWRPTRVPTIVGQTSKVLPKEIQDFRDLLILQAKDVRERCYSPSAWLSRGNVLLSLAYPELAAGDAYKAIRLCDTGISSDDTLGIKVRLEVGMLLMLEDPGAKLWAATEAGEEARSLVNSHLKKSRKISYGLLLTALCDTQDYYEALKRCRKAGNLYPSDHSFAGRSREIKGLIQSRESALQSKGMSKAEVDEQMSTGCARMRLYPWVPKAFLRRSPELISISNAALRYYSDCLQIKASSIGDSVAASSNQDGAKCLGYFATRNIAKGELILSAPTALGVCSRQTTTRCYNCSEALLSLQSLGFECCPMMRFCSVSCKTIANENYHKSLCGRNFKKIYDVAAMATDVHSKAIYSLFWLRLLACCVQEGCHPLETFRMARLVPQYKKDTAVGWTLGANVVMPLHILESLGIDIFADSRYECWVLETMWHRVTNNCSHYNREGVQCFNLNEYYSIFNHSCRFPPMLAAASVTSRTAWTAICKIRKDEEVFTSYIGGATGMPRATRHKELAPWLDQPCTCTRCKSGN